MPAIAPHGKLIATRYSGTADRRGNVVCLWTVAIGLPDWSKPMLRIKNACETFLLALERAEELESDEVFIVLDDCARRKGYTISAEQRGIMGTFIHFVKMED